ncbi:uncharacterized protein LOC124639232 [Helicoverpa zea]|uniref:uncharacterized protein LOC124639232 n=1 Tax=Helicoverpa zea TaxID=7113 RepID=UPI001F593ADE|nr:uncharacterized protein LOC124639232 [Helicoverpa zea]
MYQCTAMIVFILVVGLIPYAVPESCFYQRCLGCHPEQVIAPGRSVDCHPTNWVSATWVHNYGHPPPSTDSKIPIEYRCLKMVATPDDKTFGNTVDTLRGCIPRAQIDSVCLGLLAVERARGHSDARCFICNGNDCNSVAKTHPLPLVVFIAISLLYFILR